MSKFHQEVIHDLLGTIHWMAGELPKDRSRLVRKILNKYIVANGLTPKKPKKKKGKQ